VFACKIKQNTKTNSGKVVLDCLQSFAILSKEKSTEKMCISIVIYDVHWSELYFRS